MIHEDQAGLILFDFLHTLLGVVKAGAGKTEGAQQPNESPPEEGRFLWQPVGRQGDGCHLFIIQFLYGGFHGETSFLGSLPGDARGSE